MPSKKKKNSAYFTHPDFSASKIEKKNAQITRANTIIHFLLSVRSPFVGGPVCQSVSPANCRVAFAIKFAWYAPHTLPSVHL